jgi:hypothetical protein
MNTRNVGGPLDWHTLYGPRTPAAEPIDEATKARIRRLRANGLSVENVAVALRTPIETVVDVVATVHT